MRAYGSRAPAKVRDPRDTWHWRTKVRPVVLQRDRYVCHWNYPGICRGRANTVDHVVALAEGGAPFDLGNLVAACGPCNSSRSPGGRRGWVKGQGQRSSQMYAPAVRISQETLVVSASLAGRTQRNDTMGRFFSGGVDAECARRPYTSPSQGDLPTLLHADAGATQRLAADTGSLGGFPRLSGYYGRSGASGDGVR